MTAREQFLAVLFNGPLTPADAVVLLTGDGTVRLPVAVELIKSGAAPTLVVTGGLDDPPRSITAKATAPLLYGMGVAPSAVVLDNDAKNTWEQAVNVVRMAEDREWKRLLLVASPYHTPRAFLTFLKALDERDMADTVSIIPVPATHTPWFNAPDGFDQTRLELMDDEFGKCARYAAHVATWDRGLDYLKAWEGR